jgi:hypothetical protein
MAATIKDHDQAVTDRETQPETETEPEKATA